MESEEDIGVFDKLGEDGGDGGSKEASISRPVSASPIFTSVRIWITADEPFDDERRCLRARAASSLERRRLAIWCRRVLRSSALRWRSAKARFSSARCEVVSRSLMWV